jgi:riboflavin kinase / FMN adenylyltransferase
MRLIRNLDELRESRAARVVTVGNFDGVHLAHQMLFGRVVERARARGAVAAVLTFDPHPTQILSPERAPKLLTPLAEKARLIEALGIDLLVALPFTAELARMSPSDFVRDVLVRRMRATAVVVGPNFRFGYRQAGDIEHLAQFAREHGFELDILQALKIRGQAVSSTKIRELVGLGRVHLAGRLLGRAFSVSGPIVRGLGIGREQTVPTLNLAPTNRQLPKTGVYVTRTRVAGLEHESVVNVGRKPTFGEHEVTVESYLLDYRDGRIEADDMSIEFLHRLRDERKFPNAAALKAQIIKDAGRALRLFRLLRLFEAHSLKVLE